MASNNNNASTASVNVNEIEKNDTDNALITNGILNGIKTGDIKFSINIPGYNTINVNIIENNNFLNVNILTRDSDLYQKIKKQKEKMQSNMSGILGKTVKMAIDYEE